MSLNESELWILAGLCFLCYSCQFSRPSEISKHLIQHLLASFWYNLIAALPFCVWRWSCSWNNWKWWIATLSDSTDITDTQREYHVFRKSEQLRKQQCWDYKDNNLSTSLRKSKLYGWQEMHKNMKDEKAVNTVYIFIMTVLLHLLNICKGFIDTVLW